MNSEFHLINCSLIILSGGSMRKLSSLMVICFLTITPLFAQDPGTNHNGLPLTEPQLGSIIPVVTEIGFISLSVDGLGTNNANGGIIQVNKPVGATVRAAYIAAASTGSSGRQLNDGHVSIDGAGVNWDISTPSSISSWNHWADVTSLVKPKVDLAPAGLVDFEISEVDPSGIDGEIIAVIFDDPNQTASNTIVLLFGAQNVLGDNFAIGLANPINLSDPDLVLDFSLGIGFGFQPSGQYSQVDVNGQRLTTSAGGQDDGEAANGALLTVGGIGDINTNPPDPFQTGGGGPRYDDELYDLIPFVTDGATAINVFTQNPSTDDNIFFAALFLGSTTAIVGEGILLSPLNATNPVGTNHTVTAKVQNDLGDPIVGRTVNFEIVNGPNIGLTDSDVTDVNGEATFTYSSAVAGIDEISSNMTNTQGNLVTSNSVIKKWTMATQFPFMTIWAVNDDTDGALQYYTLALNNTFLNVEGNILGVSGPKDIEDLIIDSEGTFYFVNNVGTSTIYKIDYSELDQNNATPVQSILIGSTGLPTDPNTDSPEEIASLLFYEIPTDGIIFSNLYGIGKASKKLYNISTIDGSIVEIATLNVNGDFRTDGMTLAADGTVYLLKTNEVGESEIWKFNQFPSGDISYVRQIETSGKVEALTAHPDEFLYASDEDRLFQISVVDNYIGYLADYTVDIEGMDYFFEFEDNQPVAPVMLFTPIDGTTSVKNLNDGIPTEYLLTQNYPNPFNPSTVINYSIPKSGFVKISVFNLLGEKVATLVNETLQAGKYSVNFDAVNLPSGLYVYRLETESFTQSMKMMLMK